MWAESDRPREKLLQLGVRSLSDAELIAIILGSGSRDETAVDLARRILGECNNNLNSLSAKSHGDLMRFRGVGTAKAVTLVAAMELGRRIQSGELPEKIKIDQSRKAYQYLDRFLGREPYEMFYVLLLDQANQVIGHRQISEGGVSGTVADPRKIFRLALEYRASRIILCHNHPSGNLKPSDTDITLTRKLIQAGKMIDIPVLDHIILGDRNYFSFADEGLMEG